MATSLVQGMRIDEHGDLPASNEDESSINQSSQSIYQSTSQTPEFISYDVSYATSYNPSPSMTRTSSAASPHSFSDSFNQSSMSEVPHITISSESYEVGLPNLHRTQSLFVGNQSINQSMNALPYQNAFRPFAPIMVEYFLSKNSNYSLLDGPRVQKFYGTLLFVDMSGFTPLSEKLSERPEGLEILSGHLNSYFGGMVDIVHRYQGDIAKFAGDALMICFPLVDDMFHQSITQTSEQLSAASKPNPSTSTVTSDTVNDSSPSPSIPSHPSSTLPSQSTSSTRTPDKQAMHDLVMRACSCALAIHNQFDEFQPEVGIKLRLHSAISAGLMFGVHVGGYDQSKVNSSSQSTATQSSTPPNNDTNMRWEWLIKGQPLEHLGEAMKSSDKGLVVLHQSAHQYVTESITSRPVIKQSHHHHHHHSHSSDLSHSHLSNHIHAVPETLQHSPHESPTKPIEPVTCHVLIDDKPVDSRSPSDCTPSSRKPRLKICVPPGSPDRLGPYNRSVNSLSARSSSGSSRSLSPASPYQPTFHSSRAPRSHSASNSIAHSNNQSSSSFLSPRGHLSDHPFPTSSANAFLRDSELSFGEFFRRRSALVSQSLSPAIEPDFPLSRPMASSNHTASQLKLVLPEEVDQKCEIALRSYVPSAVLARVAAGHRAWLAEFRRVTTLFILLPEQDFSETSSDQTITQSVNQLQEIVYSLMEICFRHKGDIRQLITDDKGTVMIFLFGLQADWSNPLRGVRAALDVTQKMKELGYFCPVGLTTGKVFCGTVGNYLRCEYTAVGDKVNTAARLMVAVQQAAQSHLSTDEQQSRPAIYVDQDTVLATGASSAISFHALPPIRVKGKAEPIPIFTPSRRSQSLMSKKSLQQIDRRWGEKMTGRKAQRALIDRFLTTSLSDERYCSILYIEAQQRGVGKSVLLSATYARCIELKMIVLMGVGTEGDQSTPYAVFESIIPKMLKILHDLRVGENRQSSKQLKDSDTLGDKQTDISDPEHSLVHSTKFDDIGLFDDDECEQSVNPEWLHDPDCLAIDDDLKQSGELCLLNDLCSIVNFQHTDVLSINLAPPTSSVISPSDALHQQATQQQNQLVVNAYQQHSQSKSQSSSPLPPAHPPTLMMRAKSQISFSNNSASPSHHSSNNASASQSKIPSHDSSNVQSHTASPAQTSMLSVPIPSLIVTSPQSAGGRTVNSQSIAQSPNQPVHQLHMPSRHMSEIWPASARASRLLVRNNSSLPMPLTTSTINQLNNSNYQTNNPWSSTSLSPSPSPPPTSSGNDHTPQASTYTINPAWPRNLSLSPPGPRSGAITPVVSPHPGLAPNQSGTQQLHNQTSRDSVLQPVSRTTAHDSISIAIVGSYSQNSSTHEQSNSPQPNSPTLAPPPTTRSTTAGALAHYHSKNPPSFPSLARQSSMGPTPLRRTSTTHPSTLHQSINQSIFQLRGRHPVMKQSAKQSTGSDRAAAIASLMVRLLISIRQLTNKKIVCLIDDIDQVDSASEQLLLSIIKQTINQPILFIFACLKGENDPECGIKRALTQFRTRAERMAEKAALVDARIKRKPRSNNQSISQIPLGPSSSFEAKVAQRFNASQHAKKKTDDTRQRSTSQISPNVLGQSNLMTVSQSNSISQSTGSSTRTLTPVKQTMSSISGSTPGSPGLPSGRTLSQSGASTTMSSLSLTAMPSPYLGSKTRLKRPQFSTLPATYSSHQRNNSVEHGNQLATDSAIQSISWDQPDDQSDDTASRTEDSKALRFALQPRKPTASISQSPTQLPSHADSESILAPPVASRSVTAGALALSRRVARSLNQSNNPSRMRSSSTASDSDQPTNQTKLPAVFIQLGSLDESEMGDLLQSVLKCQSVSPEVIKLILDRSNGVPLFAEELAVQMLNARVIQLVPEPTVISSTSVSRHSLASTPGSNSPTTTSPATSQAGVDPTHRSRPSITIGTRLNSINQVIENELHHAPHIARSASQHVLNLHHPGAGGPSNSHPAILLPAAAPLTASFSAHNIPHGLPQSTHSLSATSSPVLSALDAPLSPSPLHRRGSGRHSSRAQHHQLINQANLHDRSDSSNSSPLVRLRSRGHSPTRAANQSIRLMCTLTQPLDQSVNLLLSSIPVSMDEMIASQIDALPPELQFLIKICAVFGRVVDARCIRQVWSLYGTKRSARSKRRKSIAVALSQSTTMPPVSRLSSEPADVERRARSVSIEASEFEKDMEALVERKWLKRLVGANVEQLSVADQTVDPSASSVSPLSPASMSLDGGDMFVFRHAVAVSVAYNRLPFSMRGILHKSIGEWYEHVYSISLSNFYSKLAWHWQQAALYINGDSTSNNQSLTQPIKESIHSPVTPVSPRPSDDGSEPNNSSTTHSTPASTPSTSPHSHHQTLAPVAPQSANSAERTIRPSPAETLRSMLTSPPVSGSHSSVPSPSHGIPPFTASQSMPVMTRLSLSSSPSQSTMVYVKQQSIKYLRLAGEQAARNCARREAINYLQKAMDFIDGLADSDELYWLREKLAILTVYCSCYSVLHGLGQSIKQWVKLCELCDQVQEMSEHESTPQSIDEGGLLPSQPAFDPSERSFSHGHNTPISPPNCLLSRSTFYALRGYLLALYNANEAPINHSISMATAGRMTRIAQLSNNWLMQANALVTLAFVQSQACQYEDAMLNARRAYELCDANASINHSINQGAHTAAPLDPAVAALTLKLMIHLVRGQLRPAFECADRAINRSIQQGEPVTMHHALTAYSFATYFCECQPTLDQSITQSIASSDVGSSILYDICTAIHRARQSELIDCFDLDAVQSDAISAWARWEGGARFFVASTGAMCELLLIAGFWQIGRVLCGHWKLMAEFLCDGDESDNTSFNLTINPSASHYFSECLRYEALFLLEQAESIIEQQSDNVSVDDQIKQSIDTIHEDSDPDVSFTSDQYVAEHPPLQRPYSDPLPLDSNHEQYILESTEQSTSPCDSSSSDDESDEDQDELIDPWQLRDQARQSLEQSIYLSIKQSAPMLELKSMMHLLPLLRFFLSHNASSDHFASPSHSQFNSRSSSPSGKQNIVHSHRVEQLEQRIIELINQLIDYSHLPLLQQAQEAVGMFDELSIDQSVQTFSPLNEDDLFHRSFESNFDFHSFNQSINQTINQHPHPGRSQSTVDADDSSQTSEDTVVLSDEELDRAFTN